MCSLHVGSNPTHGAASLHTPTHPPIFYPLSRALPSWRRGEGGKDRHTSVWLLCWALGGKGNGSIKNALQFGVEGVRLSGRQGWAEHVLLIPARASHQQQRQQQTNPNCACAATLYTHISSCLMHCRVSLWAYWALYQSVHSHKSFRRTGLCVVLPTHHGLTPAIS